MKHNLEFFLPSFTNKKFGENEIDKSSYIDISAELGLDSKLLVARNALDSSAKELLTKDFLNFIIKLHKSHNERRINLLKIREDRQIQYNQGDLPTFLTQNYRQENLPGIDSDWKIKSIPEDLTQRRVEITGPVNSKKMVINMLSRGSDGYRADCAMLDFEDSMKPSWSNVIEGHHNVVLAIRGELSTEEKKADGSTKSYKLDPKDMAKVMVRVRGLHLFESNIIIENDFVSAGLFDLALSAFLNVKYQFKNKQTPKYYVPKIENHFEANWWNQLFSSIENQLDVPVGTIKATFLIETLPAAFEIEEIIYELKEHIVGLNGGRWDKIFSDIKCVIKHADRVLEDRGNIGMNTPWMKNYITRLIHLCHKRGIFAMGGMAAFTPGGTQELREEQTNKVKEDKKLESQRGHDGCWVSHPYFIGPALNEFKEKNQLGVIPELTEVSKNLLPQGGKSITIQGLRKNIRVGIAYLKGWNEDIGCIAWENLMEDLATLEISRAQVLQWLSNSSVSTCNQTINSSLISKIFEEELELISSELSLSEENRKEWQKAKEMAYSLFTEVEPMRQFLSFYSNPKV